MHVIYESCSKAMANVKGFQKGTNKRRNGQRDGQTDIRTDGQTDEPKTICSRLIDAGT